VVTRWLLDFLFDFTRTTISTECQFKSSSLYIRSSCPSQPKIAVSDLLLRALKSLYMCIFLFLQFEELRASLYPDDPSAV